MFNRVPLTLAGLLLLAAPAFADTLTLTIENVPADSGQVFASLCGNPNGQFPGGCHTYVVVAPAHKGTLALGFKDIPAGTYALSAIYDANGNGKYDAPLDAFAFGNNAPDRPSFAAAAVTIAGVATADIRLVNPFSR